MVLLTLGGVAGAITNAFDVTMNLIANGIAPFVIFFMVILFFSTQGFLIYLLARVVRFIAESVIPFLAKFAFVIDNFEKLRELTNSGLFDKKEK